MVPNQTESYQLELRYVIKYLVAAKFKACEIYRKLSDAYGEAYFSQKNVSRWAK